MQANHIANLSPLFLQSGSSLLPQLHNNIAGCDDDHHHGDDCLLLLQVLHEQLVCRRKSAFAVGKLQKRAVKRDFLEILSFFWNVNETTIKVCERNAIFFRILPLVFIGHLLCGQK